MLLGEGGGKGGEEYTQLEGNLSGASNPGLTDPGRLPKESDNRYEP